jgi:hypothetical protein
MIPEAVQKWDSNPFYRKHPIIVKLSGLAIIEGLNSMLSIYLPGDVLYSLGVSVAFGIYGIDMLVCAIRKKRGWTVSLGFLIVLEVSIVLYLYTSLYYFGPIALFPCIYLYCVKLFSERRSWRIEASTRSG